MKIFSLMFPTVLGTCGPILSLMLLSLVRQILQHSTSLQESVSTECIQDSRLQVNRHNYKFCVVIYKRSHANHNMGSTELYIHIQVRLIAIQDLQHIQIYVVKLITIWVQRSYIYIYLGQVNRNTRFAAYLDLRTKVQRNSSRLLWDMSLYLLYMNKYIFRYTFMNPEYFFINIFK